MLPEDDVILEDAADGEEPTLEPGDDDPDAADPEAAVLDAEEVEEEEEPPAPPPRPVKKRTTLKGSTNFGGVPRAKLDDPKVAADVWAKLREGVGAINPAPYTVQGLFKPDDIIDHKKFGVGFVIAVPGGKKAEVLFEDCVRKLVQGR